MHTSSSCRHGLGKLKVDTGWDLSLEWKEEGAGGGGGGGEEEEEEEEEEMLFFKCV